jgi:hypothetical protein
MKHLLLFTLCAVLTFAQQANAQSSQLIATPGYDLEIQGYADESEIVLHATIQNNTGANIDLKWQRVTNDIPAEWQTLICDNVTCWSPMVSANPVEFEVASGQSSIMDCHFKPNNTPGTGNVILRIWAANDSLNTVITVEYQCNALITGISDPFPKGTLRVYPNPARNHTNISFSSYDKVRHIEIYDIIGTQLARYNVPMGVENYYVNTEDLKEGMYFISLYNEQKKRISTKVFSKVE